MKQTWTVDSEGNVTTHASRIEAEVFASSHEGDYCAGFDSADKLESVLTTAPAGLAVLIWNGLPGVKALDRFKSRKIAAERIFKYLTKGAENFAEKLPNLKEDSDVTTRPGPKAEPVAKPKKAKRTQKTARAVKPVKSAKKPKASKRASKKPRAGRKLTKEPKTGDSKKVQVIEMISKKGGATLAAIMDATGWQAHSCRGALSTLASKGGHKIESFKTEDGERAYRIA